jgi:2-dehydropantoate 2-reductase
MRVLIVGAGNVGVVYAQHLRGAGAEVALFVKPAHEAAVRVGVALERLGFGGTTTGRLEGVAAFTAWADVAAHGPWDWVVLTVPPGALRAPGFVEGVRMALGEQGTALALVLGLGDAAWLDAQLGPGRLASGEIVLISYSAPLDAPKSSAQTCAYFVPPFAKAPLSGPQGPKLLELAQTLSRGGLATAVVTDARRQSRLPAAVLFALVSALRLVGWRFSALGGSDALALCLAAGREREAVLTASGAGATPALLGVFTPTVVRVALWCAARLLPLPLEAYLRVHFTKVGQQFVEDRARLIDSGKSLGVPTPNLEVLHQRLVSRL